MCGLLEREETPPSMQALGSEIISRRRSAPEQKRYPAWTSNKAVMVNSLSVLNWNETAPEWSKAKLSIKILQRLR